MHASARESTSNVEHAEPPFHLTYTFHPDAAQGVGKYSCLATFPWDNRSLDELWKGQLATPEANHAERPRLNQWAQACTTYAGSFVAGSDEGQVEVWVVNPDADPRKKGAVRTLFMASLKEYGPIAAVGWALSPSFLNTPYVVAAAQQHIFVFDCEEGSLVSRFHGHGGKIAVIAVHPVYPQFICSTSHDNTSRIYDLTLSPRAVIKPRPWPKTPGQYQGAPPHGFQMPNEEAGLGRCVTILMGGRSGGHDAAVLCAAFHPVDPIIVTGGMDRRIKIWQLAHLFDAKPADMSAYDDNEPIPVMDKPIFSTSKLHAARVLSVTWLQRGHLLMSHSAPSTLREVCSSPEKDGAQLRSSGTQEAEEEDLEYRHYQEPGIVCVWRWLGGPRFLPASTTPNTRVTTSYRGCPSDYQESSSFQTITKIKLPMDATVMHVRSDGQNASFALVALPNKPAVTMVYLNTLVDDIGVGPFEINKDEVTDEEWQQYQSALTYHRLGPDLSGIQLLLGSTTREVTNPNFVKACAVSNDCSTLVAVGECGIRILLRGSTT